MALPAAIRELVERPDAERRLGPFVLVDQLGRGGFAPVWLAREVYGQTELRTAALKLFSLAGRSGQAGARARIVEEARALCRVEHPNVVRFYALPIDEARGLMGLAMEYVAGLALDRHVAALGKLPVHEVLEIGVAMASALAAVHRAGLVHRDVKPANVIEAGGVYKLIDFGIAAADEASPTAKERIVLLDDLPVEVGTRLSALATSTATGNLAGGAGLTGTIGYIDPECVANGAPATPASDLYGLGATLYECLVGAIPAGGGGAGLRGDVLDGRSLAPPVRERVPDAPAALADVIDALIEPTRELRPRSAEWVAIALEQVRRDLAGRTRRLPPESVGPFRGLGRFEGEHRDVYFGRTSEIAAALETLRGRGLVALVGPSGSGKSSLARAGVLPALAEGALGAWPPKWDVLVAEPGRDARASLSAALAPAIDDAHELSPDDIAAMLAERAQTDAIGTVLFVDQLEELATVSSPESRSWAAAVLARLGEQPIPGVRTVVAARRDLLDPLLALAPLGSMLVRSSVLIEPMTDATWGEALEQALGAYGYSLEDDDLRKKLLAQLAGTAGAMPLVQFALTELWGKRDAAGKRITHQGFDAIGGIAGALERHADATLDRVERRVPGARATARAVLLALTTPQGTRATRSDADLALGEAAVPVIDALIEARLVVRGGDGVTLAHEALITQWGALRSWVAAAREDRVLAEELERDAARWAKAPDVVPLWPGRRVGFVDEARTRGDVSVSSAANAFLEASQRAERRAKSVRWAAGAVAGLLVVVGGAAYVSAVKREESRTRDALLKEHATREIAEQRTREVQEAQARIDQLLKDLADSPTKESVKELQAKIRGADAPPPEAHEKKPVAARAVAPPAAEAPREPAAAAPPPPAGKPVVKVQKEWLVTPSSARASGPTR